MSRLACPACGTALAVGPGNAGRIVPCPGCGCDVQLPAEPPPAARSARESRTRDDSDDGDTDRPRARRRARPRAEEREQRGSLVWLWVLLGTGFIGLAVGAGAFLLIGWRAKPEPVAEPPRNEPAPNDTRSGAPPKRPEPAPPVGAPTGARFHLACDTIENGAVLESVSGKFVGKGQNLELVDGPRGKAIRVIAGVPGGALEGLKLTDQINALAIEAGKPFTLALWVRTDHAWTTRAGRLLGGAVPGKDKVGAFFLHIQTRGVGVFLHDAPLPAGTKPLLGGTREMAPTKDWFHLALTRDEKGAVRLAVNGESEAIGSAPYAGAIRFNTFSLGWVREPPFTAEFAEFYLFDRVLTDDEIKKLAEKAK